MIANEVVYVYDVLRIAKQLQQRAAADNPLKSAEYNLFHKGACHAYEQAAKLLLELVEEFTSLDVQAEIETLS